MSYTIPITTPADLTDPNINVLLGHVGDQSLSAAPLNQFITKVADQASAIVGAALALANGPEREVFITSAFGDVIGRSFYFSAPLTNTFGQPIGATYR